MLRYGSRRRAVADHDNYRAVKPTLSDWEREWRTVTRPIRAALRPFVQEYHDLLKRLRAEGFRVRWTSPMCPVQLAGHLPSGEKLYFHCHFEIV
jgi:hypothetical protein